MNGGDMDMITQLVSSLFGGGMGAENGSNENIKNHEGVMKQFSILGDQNKEPNNDEIDSIIK